MEYLDIVNEDAKPTGKKQRKDLVHAHGELHVTVHVWVLTPRGEVVLQQRGKKVETYPEKWDISATGHVAAGEDPVQGAIREVQEETGLVIPQDLVEFLFRVDEHDVLKHGTYIERAVNFVYCAVHDVQQSDIRIPEGEVMDATLMPLERFAADFAAHPEKYVLRKEEYRRAFALLIPRFTQS